MKKLFIDVEFNSDQGELISMALVPVDEGGYFYEVVEFEQQVHPWVEEHVIPVLDKPAITKREFQMKLDAFLRPYYEGFHIVADFPEDIKYFCMAIITGPGTCLNLPPFICEVNPFINGESSRPHNALADARGNRNEYLYLLKGKYDA